MRCASSPTASVTAAPPVRPPSPARRYVSSTTELVNLVTLRDVAELELHVPGFARAVYEWIDEMHE
jgi:hypothetical protein